MKLKSRTLTNVVARAASAKIGGNQHAALFSYEPGFLRLVMCDNRSDNNTTLHMLLSGLNIRNSRIRIILDMRILIFIYYKKSLTERELRMIDNIEKLRCFDYINVRK